MQKMPVPFVIAHRAGNDLELLASAERLGARLIEADVRLFAGRLEVRHLKSVGPLPLFWDRWELAPPWTPRLTLARLLDAARPGTTLLLDLKGSDRRMVGALADNLGGSDPGAQPVLCSQSWDLLDAAAAATGARAVHSVGSRRGLAALRSRFAGRRLGGVSIHRKLLDPATVAELRERAETVLSWPVTTLAEARMLSSWGVDGLITERFESLLPALAGEPMTMAA